jgi:hypothetical protein
LLGLGMRLGYLRSDAILDSEQLDDRQAVLGLSLVNERSVAESQVVELQ